MTFTFSNWCEHYSLLGVSLGSDLLLIAAFLSRVMGFDLVAPETVLFMNTGAFGVLFLWFIIKAGFREGLLQAVGNAPTFLGFPVRTLLFTFGARRLRRAEVRSELPERAPEPLPAPAKIPAEEPRKFLGEIAIHRRGNAVNLKNLV